MPLPKLIKFIKKYFPLALFVLSLFFIIKTLFLNYYPDFRVHYLAPLAIFKGLNPYLGGKNYFTPDVHPPFTILLFSPFTLFSYYLAEKLWTLLSIIFLLVSLDLIFKINKEKMFSGVGLILCSIIFSFYFPVKFTLGMGQINFLILFLTLLSIYFLQKKKHNFSGVFLGLSIMIKLFPVLFLPYLMILKKWRILFSFMLVCLFTLLLTFIIIKPDINLYFYKNIVPTLLNGWKTDYYNQSLSGFLGRQMGPGFLREALRELISVVLIALSFLIIWLKNSKKAAAVNLTFSLLITLSLLINNFSWQHHFVWLLFPFITIFYFMKDKKLSWYYYLVLGISFFLVGFNLKSPNLLPVILISHVFYGALMLWGLNLYLLAKRF
jgi:hypothetical protein